jgi:membrane-associated PAP2 superfamily phosphatase
LVEEVMLRSVARSLGSLFRSDHQPGNKSCGSSQFRGVLIVGGLFLFGVTATLVLSLTGWDLSWPASVYSPGGMHGGWHYACDLPWKPLYDYGEIPAMLLAVGALILLGMTRLGKISTDYRKPCLVIILTVVLGPGLIVNGLFKPLWGRPRPAEIAQFGGSEQYRPVWRPGELGNGKAFPSGHCASAFAIASLAAFYPWHPWFGVSMLVAGAAYGVLMGIARVIQGAHYPTDVLWAGIVVITVIGLLYYVVLRVPEHGQRSYRRSEHED